jgi:hypothetical protein
VLQSRQAPLGDLREPARSLAWIAQARAEVVPGEPRPLEVTLERRHVGRRDAGRPQRRDLRADADQRVPHANEHHAALDGRPRHTRHDHAAHVHQKLTHRSGSNSLDGRGGGQHGGKLVQLVDRKADEAKPERDTLWKGRPDTHHDDAGFGAHAVAGR